MNGITGSGARQHKAGGWAALYLALAYIAAMPYFLLVVDYQGATTAAQKVALIVNNYSSMYAMYLVTYIFFGVALGVLALALHDRLRAEAPFGARVTAVVGGMWAFALVACGLVFTYGMTSIVALAETDAAQAQSVWQAVEPVALGLGGAGGETLGGLWVLIVSAIALRTGALPKALGWLGALVGAFGIASTVPALNDAAMGFGLLQIVWFAWVGLTLMRKRPVPETAESKQAAVSPAFASGMNAS